MSRQNFRPATLALAIALALGAAAVHAQGAAGSHEAPVRISIQAQPLAEALNDWARQTRIQVIAPQGLVGGKAAPAVSGALTPSQALERLLAGSGLTAAREGGAVVIKAASKPTTIETGATTLAEVRVTAQAVRDGSTEGTGEYKASVTRSATGLTLTQRETPQSVSVITRQEMDDYNLSTINDVLQSTPGISVEVLQQGRQDYKARGFSITNFQYDGVPSYFDFTYGAQQSLSDMAMFDRVEVVKGAAGLMSPSGDPSATINLIRKKPTRSFQGYVSGGAASWNDYHGELDLGGPLNQAGIVRARAVASVRDRDSFVDRFERKTQMLYGVVEADLSPATLLTVGADWQETVSKGQTSAGIPLLDSNGNFNETPRSFNTSSRWGRWAPSAAGVFATLEHQFDNDWAIKLNAAHREGKHNDYSGGVTRGFPNSADGSGALLSGLGRYLGESKEDSVDLRATGAVQLMGRKHELIVGGSSYRRNWYTDNFDEEAGYPRDVTNFYDWTGDVPEPRWTYAGSVIQTRREHALYGALRLNLHDDLKLIMGGRAIRYESTNDSFLARAVQETRKSVLVPYIGVIYDLTPQLSAYASYTSIFKPQYAQDRVGRTLDPLEGANTEVGLKGEFFDKRLNASLALFQVKQDNYAKSTGEKTPSGGTAYEAVNGVKTKGLELEIVGHVTPQWQIHAGFTHKAARRLGSKLGTTIPENQFTLRSSYRFRGDLAGLMLGGGVRWQSKTWTDISFDPTDSTIRHTAPSYAVLDLVANYQVNRNLSASLIVTNLLDKKYHSIMETYSTYAWGEPRRIAVNLKYQF